MVIAALRSVLQESGDLVKTETVDLGFIYDAKKQQQVIETMIDHFKELSIEYNVRVILFTIENLNIEGQFINGTTINGNCIRQECTRLPLVMFNFAMHHTGNQIEIMRNLRKIETITVINPINRFSQSIIFEMLSALMGSQRFLLPSAPFKNSTLKEYLNKKYHTLFLLPEKTFHPPKAVIIKNSQDNNYIVYIGQKGQICGKDDIQEYIKKMVNKKKHVLMKGIECLTWGEGPLEARVYLQKGASGEWSIIAMRAKSSLFSRDTFDYTKINDMLNGLSSNEYKDIEQRLTDISLQIVRFLDFHIPCLGSCSIDYIFDENHCPYLVYMGGFEQNQYLYLSMDPAAQYNILNITFQYLLFLLNNTKEKG